MSCESRVGRERVRRGLEELRLLLVELARACLQQRAKHDLINALSVVTGYQCLLAEETAEDGELLAEIEVVVAKAQQTIDRVAASQPPLRSSSPDLMEG